MPKSETGDSVLRGPDNAEDMTLLSLSIPASLSMSIEARALKDGMPAGTALDLGVLEPRGLLDLVEVAVEDARLWADNKIAGSEELRRALAMADGASNEHGNMDSSAVFESVICSSSGSNGSCSCSSLESLRLPAAI
jgi:hypothetical protein